MCKNCYTRSEISGDLAFEDGIITELGVVDQKDNDVELRYDDAIITPV